MNTRLAALIELLARATSPADVFGPLAGDQAAELRRRHRELAAVAHPDRNPEAPDAAAGAFKALQEWLRAAQEQLARGAYGAPAPSVALSSGGRRYEGYGPPIAGDLCDLYRGRGPRGGAVLIKVSRHPRNNDLLEAEARALGLLGRELAGQPVRAHFPTLADSLLVADGSGAHRRANVLAEEGGALTLAEVIRAMPGGLDPADGAWIFNRMLTALATAHSLGLVHGAVTPDHVLIRPADHNAILLDWCYSVEAGAGLLAVPPPYSGDYPPEVAAREPATPATDLYLAARCMVRLLGGDDSVARLPAHVPPAMAALLRACLIPAPSRRPADAWQVFDDFQELLREHYGPPTFRHFPLSA